MAYCRNCGNNIGGGQQCLRCGHHEDRIPVAPEAARPRIETGPKVALGCLGLVALLFLLGSIGGRSGDSGTSPAAAPRQSVAPRVYVPPASAAPLAYEVTYTVGGSTSSASITYQNATGSTEQDDAVTVPWFSTFSASPGDFLYISAQNNNESGTVTCQIAVNGTVIKTAHSSGAYTIATCSGAAK